MTAEDRVGNSHGDDGRFVSVRELLEAAFEDAWDAHAQQHVSDERALVKAAGLADTIATNLWKAHADQHVNSDRELVENRKTIEARLEELNNLRRDYVADRGQYVLKDVFQTRLEPLDNFRAKALGFGALISLISGVVGAIIARMFT
jgi:hypothetical protein